MEHQGKKLKTLIHFKGMTVNSLVEPLKKTRVAIYNDLSKEVISRKVLAQYAELLKFDIDEFYKQNALQSKVDGEDSVSKVIELQQQLLEEKDRVIRLLQQQLSFFRMAG